jgi:hypothetical protein
MASHHRGGESTGKPPAYLYLNTPLIGKLLRIKEEGSANPGLSGEAGLEAKRPSFKEMPGQNRE